MTPVIHTEALSKRYRRHLALDDCTLIDPGRPDRRPGRPERRRQVDAARAGLRHDRADRRKHRGARPPAGRQRRAARPGRVRRAGRAGLLPAHGRRPPAARRPAQPAVGRGVGGAADPRQRPGPGQKAGSLSGGQRAQLALTVAAAKRADLLVLDEPVAALDPLARRAFLRDLLDFVDELAGQRRALVAPARRPGAGLRPPDRARRRPGADRRRRRRPARRPLPDHGAARTTDTGRRPAPR